MILYITDVNGVNDAIKVIDKIHKMDNFICWWKEKKNRCKYQICPWGSVKHLCCVLIIKITQLVPFSCLMFSVLVSCMLSCLTGTLEQNRAIVKVKLVTPVLSLPRQIKIST